jgi:hypothetical protein
MRTGTGSPAAPLRHRQSRAGKRQSGHILPAAVEYTTRPMSVASKARSCAKSDRSGKDWQFHNSR